MPSRAANSFFQADESQDGGQKVHANSISVDPLP